MVDIYVMLLWNEIEEASKCHCRRSLQTQAQVFSLQWLVCNCVYNSIYGHGFGMYAIAFV